MGRTRAVPKTELGAALQKKRGALSGRVVAREIGVTPSALYRAERGAAPSEAVARVLWGWIRRA